MIERDIMRLAGALGGTGAGIAVYYRPNSGDWQAVIDVKPPRKRDRYVYALGTSPRDALSVLRAKLERMS